MKTKKITCDHCGAALAIDGTSEFIDCNFCNTSLRIVRTKSATFTQVLETVEAIGTEVSRLRKESKLRALEDRWRSQREKLYHGSEPERHPTRGKALFVALFAGGHVVFCCVIALYRGGLTAQLAMGSAIFIAIFGLIGYTRIMHYVNRYEAAERTYLAKRSAIEQKYNKKRKQKAKQSTDTGRRTSAIK